VNIYQDIFFKNLDRIRGRRTIERLHFLRRSQYWSPAKLEEWQLTRLNLLLSQAKVHSKYYADILHDVPLPLKMLDDIEKIPILTKDNVRKNYNEIRCLNIDKNRFVAHMTGGSTGEPMHYFWDKQGQDWNRASVYRSAEWAGTALGEKSIQMSGSHFDYNQMQSIKNKIVYFLQRYRDCPVAYLDNQLLEKYFRELKIFKPASLWGYASGLAVFAKYIDAHHPNADMKFVKAVMPSSETLNRSQRELLNNIFGQGKVYDQYGSRECYIASECNMHQGYHIHAEVLYVEIVDKHNRAAKPGEMGRVLITDLSNHAFPFIRYEIGDIAAKSENEECKCGVMLPMLKSVNGRIADLVILKNRVLTAPNFTILLSDKKGIKSFQIKQSTLDSLEVFLETDNDFTGDTLGYVKKGMHELCGDGVSLSFNIVDKISVPQSGKRRFIISSVSKDYI